MSSPPKPDQDPPEEGTEDVEVCTDLDELPPLDYTFFGFAFEDTLDVFDEEISAMDLEGHNRGVGRAHERASRDSAWDSITTQIDDLFKD